MIKNSIDPACTGQFSKFFLDYIHQNEKLKPFYNLFPSIENFQKVIDQRNFSTDKRHILAEVLKKQYSQIGEDHPNVALLKKSNTFTVTTGHQLNLMTGPLYFIYKIISTINLAEKLTKAFPKYSFVPIYWMATEDHDFAEINHFNFDGKKHEWISDQSGAVGEFHIDDTLKQLLNNNSYIPQFLKEAYLSSENLGDAVRKYVHHLFGDKGLVVVDGNDRELKRLFAPMIASDLFEMKANDLVQNSTGSLEKMGYKSQIHPRDINFFYLDKGIRERIVYTEGVYKINNSDLSFSREDLKELLTLSPERFSPNVVMRPLYQEEILPNLAYLGGPAEVVYWLQLKQVFDHFQVDFPILLPRNFAVVIDKNTKRKIVSLGLSHEDLFSDFISWKKKFIEKNSVLDLSLLHEKEKINAVIEQIKSDAGKVDNTLSQSTESMKVRIEKIVDHFSKKIRKAEERNFEISINKMEAIKSALFPKGVPQERICNFLQFYLEDENFIQNLYELFDPLDFSYIIIEPDGK